MCIRALTCVRAPLAAAVAGLDDRAVTDPCFLGIEGGGTHTTALLADASGRALFQGSFGPGNVRLLTDTALKTLLRAIARSLSAKKLPPPASIAIGLAGARRDADKERIRAAAASVWKDVSCHATNDLETALMAAPDARPGTVARVLVLSGTGSCCFGRADFGNTAKVGGWGHLLGDEGSGHDIGLIALRTAVREWDRYRHWSALGRNLLAAQQLNVPDDLIAWVQSADKAAIASLAEAVFRAAETGDPMAKEILAKAAESLSADALVCATRLCERENAVQFVFAGSVLLKQAGFAKNVAALIRQGRPKARIVSLERSGVWGAVAWAREEFEGSELGTSSIEHPTSNIEAVAKPPLSPTELRHPLSMRLDKLSIADSIDLFLTEDAKIPAAVLAEKAKLAKVVVWIVKSFRTGGRLFYVGAGTSGRLGILDASECPPTFRTPPELVQGIIAGGQQAIWRAIEGAEDDPAQGADAVVFREVGRNDVVVGIAASGRTPFVWGALDEAKRRGAKTVLLCFNPLVVAERRGRADVIIAPDTGPELLTGSTRLKSGTATKLVLNLFTTLAMVRIGKVAGNLMVDVNPSNIKLRDRAIRIVRELTGANADAARAALEKAGWVVKDALGRRGGIHPRRPRRDTKKANRR